jgi:hypothetical protein
MPLDHGCLHTSNRTREWSSGRMAPCHGVGPSSILGSRMFMPNSHIGVQELSVKACLRCTEQSGAVVSAVGP